MRCAIYKLDKFLWADLVDLWTSVQEIGTMHETYIYCRFPYHLAKQVKKLAVCLSTLEAGGSHKFTAKVTYEGRKQLNYWPVATIEPWELTCNGKKLPAMTHEDIAAATSRGSAETATDRFLAGMAYHGNMSIKDGLGEDDAMQDFLYSVEIEYIKGTQAYNCSEILLSKDKTSIARMYFQIIGKLIYAVNSGHDSPAMT